MAMVINSNIQSLNAQRHLNNSLDAQNTATERLSSGLRINSAKDDAAGLAIANRMTSQIDGLNQAIRNANDGAALIQTAEGGLEEMTNILGRMRELSIQSANGTYDSGNRDTINAEVEQLKQEINRIAATTSFNGQNILDGSMGDIQLQVGENANQTIAISIDSLKSSNMGDDGADLIGSAGTASLLATLQGIEGTGDDFLIVNGDKIQALSSTTTLDEAVGLFSDSVAGVDVSYFVEVAADDDVAGGNGALSGSDELIITLSAGNATGTDNVINIKDTSNMQDLVDQINKAGGGNVQASLNDDGNLVLLSTSSSKMVITGNGDAVLAAGFGTGTTVTQEAQLRFEITDDSLDSITIEAGTDHSNVDDIMSTLGLNKIDEDGKVIGTKDGDGATVAMGSGTQLKDDELVINGVSIGAGTTSTSVATTVASDVIAINKLTKETGVIAMANTSADGIDLISTDGGSISIESGSGFSDKTEQLRDQALFDKTGFMVQNEAEYGSSTVDSIDVTTAAGAQRAIGILDEAIQQVSDTRGELGAVANRLDYTTRNLANISENASSARSQIMDADFAAESANLSRAQVLQQAGNAMLAQANARPQQVLSLLQ